MDGTLKKHKMLGFMKASVGKKTESSEIIFFSYLYCLDLQYNYIGFDTKFVIFVFD